jgi:hypothetical protein
MGSEPTKPPAGIERVQQRIEVVGVGTATVK